MIRLTSPWVYSDATREEKYICLDSKGSDETYKICNVCEKSFVVEDCLKLPDVEPSRRMNQGEMRSVSVCFQDCELKLLPQTLKKHENTLTLSCGQV